MSEQFLEGVSAVICCTQAQSPHHDKLIAFQCCLRPGRQGHGKLPACAHAVWARSLGLAEWPGHADGPSSCFADVSCLQAPKLTQHMYRGFQLTGERTGSDSQSSAGGTRSLRRNIQRITPSWACQTEPDKTGQKLQYHRTLFSSQAGYLQLPYPEL